MGASIEWLGAVEPDETPSASVATLPAPDVAHVETCDKCGPTVRAEYRSNRYGLTFCGHCALFGAAASLHTTKIEGE